MVAGQVGQRCPFISRFLLILASLLSPLPPPASRLPCRHVPIPQSTNSSHSSIHPTSLGWECHFSLTSGQVLPVPAEDLPEALREWEVEMWGWEGTTYDDVR